MTTFSGRDGRTFDITCPDGAPTVGAWHDLNGYRFRETLHGPMRWGTCVGCGKPALEVQRVASEVSDTEARCDSCGRKHHGAFLEHYRTGRALLYRTVSPFEPHRADAQHGGVVEFADFLAQVAELKIPPHERPARCDLCAALIDPAARTVEHPNLHPTCVRGWARIRADAPMEIPLRPQDGSP